MKINLTSQERFEDRHHGKRNENLTQMLETVGVSSLNELIEQTVPAQIRLESPLNLPDAQSEVDFLKSFKKIAEKNKVFKSYIGTGYYENFTPLVILRNILENPAWYTAYTPYQAEIAQGRLEMLLNFQTMVADLTGMELANASLLDEGTAAAEAMTMFDGNKKKDKKESNTFFISELCHPQTIDVVIGRAKPLGINIVVGNHETYDLTGEDVFGALLQYPATNGEVYDYTDLIESANELNVKIVVATDLLALTLLKSPGEMGADVVVGTAQRFGVPMGFGGPHAAFFATKDEFKRQIPGRIIGVSKDREGNQALRMALQTREQHIRREKATSNICTAQVLLAVMSAAYGIYHGPEGLKRIALKTHGMAQFFANSVQGLDYRVLTSSYFDTITLDVSDNTKLREIAESKGVNLRFHGTEDVSVSFDETKTLDDVAELLEIFAEAKGQKVLMNLKGEVEAEFSSNLARKTEYMTHPVFNTHHTEHGILRYLKSLENKDLSLVHSMISLGSCTMKLNATAEMVPVTWPEIG
ncbi:MAG: glycine dehydrogenase, partial [Spirosomataceae bacterium]